MEILISKEAMDDIKLLSNKTETLKVIAKIKELNQYDLNTFYTYSRQISGYENIFVVKVNLIRLFFTLNKKDDVEKLILIAVVRKIHEKFGPELLKTLEKRNVN
ncbi:hypothetical protein [Clostridium beijerinckii]|uniref:hypothetical protein n=1 Tax=Clostridium beijerinckii TaxID=1520 RepID=UPI00149447BA|nr:hypothetical protein [Clostridium beijerinckii]NOW07657.1 mRNA-degrading endonuclease RelE of RelBE toxin-antitoxin system [Clostridium beijerinckii]NYC04570.1 mRNA-degrading endonuclease RelE of RelBE toxin-antitoxin system [Clostridium beijerinckii]